MPQTVHRVARQHPDSRHCVGNGPVSAHPARLRSHLDCCHSGLQLRFLTARHRLTDDARSRYDCISSCDGLTVAIDTVHGVAQPPSHWRARTRTAPTRPASTRMNRRPVAVTIGRTDPAPSPVGRQSLSARIRLPAPVVADCDGEDRVSVLSRFGEPRRRHHELVDDFLVGFEQETRLRSTPTAPTRA